MESGIKFEFLESVEPGKDENCKRFFDTTQIPWEKFELRRVINERHCFGCLHKERVKNDGNNNNCKIL